MNAEPKGMPGRRDLTETERQFSELVFAHYHSNPRPGGRSRLSDDLAFNLRGDTNCLMLMATLIAKMASPEHADKIGEVSGFYVTPACPSDSISDLLKTLLGDIPEPEPLSPQDIADTPLKNPFTGQANLIVIWARAFVILQGLYSNVEFEQQYAEVEDDNFRPGIRGDGINTVSVNGAILQVLDEANLLDEIDGTWFATDSDEDGWTFSRGGIDD